MHALVLVSGSVGCCSALGIPGARCRYDSLFSAVSGLQLAVAGITTGTLLVSQHPTWFSLEKKSGEWRQAACESETSWKV